MWINGAEVSSAGRDTLAVVNPATEEQIGSVVRGTPADAEAAARAAADAFPRWRRSAPAIRAALLREIADRLAAHRAELADLLVAEQGKPRRDNESEIDSAIELFTYYSGFAWRDRGAVNPAEDKVLDFVLREPVGPVACIVPWNFPIMLMARKVAPALAAGCTVVVKPSEETPLATLLFARVVADHLPPGVLNVVTGYGSEVGEPLVHDPRIRHIAFTGSTATGRRIASSAAAAMKGTTLELGGKDPLIIGPDADLETAVPAVAFAGLLNAGQCCTSTERIYVAQPLLKDFLEALVDHVRGIDVGDGARAGTVMGPLIREDARRRVGEHVTEAVAAGAKVLTGGGVPPGLDRGWFYEPTVVVDVPDSARLLREETFGPVLPVAGFASVDEAIARANDTAYGLGATVLSNDPGFVKRCIDGLDVGNVFVNDPLTAATATTFGGTKMSGMGRELGVEGFEAFRESKHVHWMFTR
ncbi:aldehyde dehydrogenase family protein [Rhizohabitans arisaemae]|uniref:aldehyde dehydrogenase family protein n=1 Tax=Rhizohabitans arisaemae TaxID=2720610 RepID=UPI0024B08189|nr:aldehyde dehydrogenase family protein [Rhizohabitans arisaemae]